ncbi:putative ABC transporter ATP-binding protein [Paraglaciecola mesophila]|uniref:Putative ABC transporter ATP-binding protein n=1 Tax=Paraglaciecola mesophila TaxID=197222 RepID=A0A857JID8_9ALTE|nr:thiol reductant ABC exporter subunit CydC [Paraglaciecola mesophila]QHJ11008.1 putative ABC transporter ATP-binding protein [Paraglaciecola mesophila]
MRNFIRLLRLCRPHYKAMLLGVFLTVLTVLSNVGLLAISGWFLASMAAAGIASAQMNYFTPAGIIRFLAIVRTASRYGERLVTHNATFLLLSEIRVNVFATLSQLNNQQLAMNRSADLFNRMQNDVDALDKFYLNVLLPMLVALVCVPIVIWIIAGFNPAVALICFCGILLVGVGLPLLLNKKLSRSAAQQIKRSAQLREILSDTLSGQRELAIYQATERQLAKCNQVQKSYNVLLEKRHKALADSDGLSLVVVQFAMLASVVILVPLVQLEQLPNVHLAMLSLFVLASFETVLSLPSAFIQLPVALSAAGRIFALHDRLPQAVDALADIPLCASKGDTNPEMQGMGLTIQNVSYQYANDPLTNALCSRPQVASEHYALQNVSFSVQANEKVALVGASGSGKSTLVNLLSGLWPEQQGSISLSRQMKAPSTSDISVVAKTLSFEQRSNLIGILAQQHHIFDGSIADNLHYASPEATKAQMIQACEQAQIGQWLQGLPNGLDTRLGSAGRRLSQGQSRRLAIAQMLLRQPAILVLDEPTEGLDNQSKQAVMQAILHAMRYSTVLCITHDPSLLQTMDKVIWLDEGQVKGEGSHQELLATQQEYAELVIRV